MLDRAMRDRVPSQRSGNGGRYVPPRDVRDAGMASLLRETGRGALEEKQLKLLKSEGEPGDVPLFFSGDISLLDRPCVAIVGSREVTDEGRRRAFKLSKELVNSGFVVVSGLAAGVDTAAHTAAIECGGNTVAVIGTPLDKAYPIENAKLQEIIYTDHLVVSPFAQGQRTFRSSFPVRNRVMAALTDATVIIEASDTSGTLHQAAECIRLGRWLFISKSLVENPRISWPEKFLKEPRCRILSATPQVIEAVISERE